jgi:hypothetical protein
MLTTPRSLAAFLVVGQVVGNECEVNGRQLRRLVRSDLVSLAAWFACVGQTPSSRSVRANASAACLSMGLPSSSQAGGVLCTAILAPRS